MQKFLITSSMAALAHALEDGSDSAATLIRNAVRLLVGVLGFSLLLIICFGVHYSYNAWKRHSFEIKYKTREAVGIKQRDYQTSRVIPKRKLSIIESESDSYSASYGDEESKVEGTTRHLTDLNVSLELIEPAPVNDAIIEEEKPKLDINDLGGYDISIAGL